MSKYFALLTNIGAAKLANATALGAQLNITHMAVGDGGGALPTPTASQTKLINEKRRAAINTLNVDPNNTNQIIAEQVIPETEGGFWIREIGLFDAEGNLIAIANCAETYKPQLQEGSGRIQTVRMILIVSSTDAVTLKIDPAVVLATRGYVDDAIATHEKSRKHPDATLKEKGLVQLSSATDSASETLAATPKAVKAANENADGRVPSGRTVNGKALSADIALGAADVGAYTKAETDTKVSAATTAASNAATAAASANTNANGRVPSGRTVNGKALSADIALGAADVGAYTKAETDTKVNAATTAANSAATAAASANDNANGRVPAGRKVNGKALTADITLAAGDVGTYTKQEINEALGGKLAKDQNGADIPDKPLFRQNVGLVKQENSVDATTGRIMTLNGDTGSFGLGGTAIRMPADADIAVWLRGVPSGLYAILPSASATNLPPNAPVGGGWVFQTIKFNANPLIMVIAQQTGVPGSAVRGVLSTTGISWFPIWDSANLPNPATLDTAQTISGAKTYKEKITISRDFPGLILEKTDVAVGTVGRVVVMDTNTTGVEFAKRSAAAVQTGQQIIRLPFPSGTTSATFNALVQNINAVADANGLWKTPESPALTAAAVGALSITELAGIPLPYPGAVAPAGFLKCNGQAFNTTLYPILAARYPSGNLPDLRGEFIRGLDDGRGVDAGRALLSAQGDAIRNITGKFANNGLAWSEGTASSVGEGAFTRLEGILPSNNYSGSVGCQYTFDASKVVPTASENRPRNTAFNYIVRAA